MLTRKLLAFTTSGAEWVLWLLVLLSVISVGVMIERAVIFARRRLPDPDGLSGRLLAGDLAGARAAVEGREGMLLDDPNGTRAAEPFFELLAVVPSTSEAAMLHGRSGKIRFDLPPEPLLHQWIRKLLQVLQKQYGL